MSFFFFPSTFIRNKKWQISKTHTNMYSQVRLKKIKEISEKVCFTYVTVSKNFIFFFSFLNYNYILNSFINDFCIK